MKDYTNVNGFARIWKDYITVIGSLMFKQLVELYDYMIVGVESYVCLHNYKDPERWCPIVSLEIRFDEHKSNVTVSSVTYVINPRK